MSEIQNIIYARMLNSAQFEFSTLHIGLHEDAYRMADKTLQSFRKRGWASFEKKGRHFVWSLTPEGRDYIVDRLARDASKASPSLPVGASDDE